MSYAYALQFLAERTVRYAKRGSSQGGLCRHMQQKAWERGTEVVRRQTMRRALQTMEKSFIEKSNRSLQDSIARSRPSSVA